MMMMMMMIDDDDDADGTQKHQQLITCMSTINICIANAPSLPCKT